MSDPALPPTERWSARYQDIETWPSHTVLTALWEAQLAAVAVVGSALPALAAAADAAAARLRQGGRLAYAGAGTSGRIGVQDGAELTPTFNWPRDRLVLLMAGGEAALTQAVEDAEDQSDAARAAVVTAGLGHLDVLVAVAASGSTPYTVACATAARAGGALTVGVANVLHSPLLLASEHPIAVPTGPEVIAGSTRLAAGTVQKVVLNLFSTLVMVRMGRVYQGQMVDMQARNAKLRRRAVRMLHDLTGASEPDGVRALAEAGGHVKAAVLIVKGMQGQDATALLEQHGGDLRRAMLSRTAHH